MKNKKSENINQIKLEQDKEQKTTIMYISDAKTDAAFLENAAIFLRTGYTVAFPTETVYGVGASAFDEEAVEKIFIAKGRPLDNPLIVHIANKEDVNKLAEYIPENAVKLMDEFWPGPLTIIFKKRECVPNVVTAGLDTVAIRMPSHPIAAKLIQLARTPIAAPSANISGKPSSTSADHVIEDLYGKVDCIVAAGKSEVGIESTVIDLTSETPVILRSGFITKQELQRVIGTVIESDGEYEIDNEIIPKSPGMKHTHYAPKASLILFKGNMNSVRLKILSNCYGYAKQNKKIGILSCDENIAYYNNEIIKTNVVLESLGSYHEPKKMAQNLFSALRKFDTLNVDVILCESFSYKGVGKAVMNRLVKASGGRIIN